MRGGMKRRVATSPLPLSCGWIRSPAEMNHSFTAVLGAVISGYQLQQIQCAFNLNLLIISTSTRQTSREEAATLEEAHSSDAFQPSWTTRKPHNFLSSPTLDKYEMRGGVCDLDDKHEDEGILAQQHRLSRSTTTSFS